MQYKEGGTTSC